MIDPHVLELLGCPLHPERPPLSQVGDQLVCQSCVCGKFRAFPIVNGIPHLLPENATDPNPSTPHE